MPDIRERPRSLAGSYLEDAVTALHRAGSPLVLYAKWQPNPPTLPQAQGMMILWAQDERFRLARTSVLFSAFAAEAYVNEFLAFKLAPERMAEIDRTGIESKFTRGVQEAHGAPLFPHDGRAMSILRELVAIRNKLAHPQPNYGPPETLLRPWDPAFTEDFFLPTVAKYATAVSMCATRLVQAAYGEEAFDVPASMFALGHEAISAYAERHRDLPSPADQAELPLYAQVSDLVASRPPST